MSEDGNFTPAHWGGGGHDFRSAYADYDRHAGRSYATAKAAGKTLNDLLPKTLVTQSSAPLVIATDETGSMEEWPKTMFSKLPYLELEAQEYLGEDMEISWAALGDAYHGESYPVQARPFTKGVELKDRLKELVIEKGGGGGGQETYELLALYLARNVQMPKAITPICIFIGDENPYPIISPDMAEEYAHVKLEKRISVEDVFAELKEKFSVYMIRKPYNLLSGDSVSPFDKATTELWSRLLGADHVYMLPQPERVVDVIFGILAKETGRIPYFQKEIEGRQHKDQVKTVYKSLRMEELPKPADEDAKASPSKTRGLGGGKPAKPLL